MKHLVAQAMVAQASPKASPAFNQLFGALKRSLPLLLILTLAMLPAMAQDITVKGRITNESGEPVARASVLVKGSSAGVNTNDNGSFEINVPSNGTLVISSVGYAQREIKVNE